MKSLVLFGDSLFGKCGKKDLAKFEKILRDTIVYNCAAGGQNSIDGVRQADFIAKLKADYVCLSLGANDSSLDIKKNVPINCFKKNILSIIKSFKKSKIIYFLCPPALDKNDLKGTEEFNQTLEKYNDVIRQICKDNNVNVVDSDKIFGKLLKEDKNYHLEDGIHMNDLGFETMFKAIKSKT